MRTRFEIVFRKSHLKVSVSTSKEAATLSGRVARAGVAVAVLVGATMSVHGTGAHSEGHYVDEITRRGRNPVAVAECNLVDFGVVFADEGYTSDQTVDGHCVRTLFELIGSTCGVRGTLRTITYADLGSGLDGDAADAAFLQLSAFPACDWDEEQRELLELAYPRPLRGVMAVRAGARLSGPKLLSLDAVTEEKEHHTSVRRFSPCFG